MKLNESTKAHLWNMFNEYTCKMCELMEKCRKKGAHTRANEIQWEIDELDEVARELGIIE